MQKNDPTDPIPSPTLRRLQLWMLSLVALLVAFVFIATVILAASDAQGAILFAVSLPACALLIGISYALAGSRSIPKIMLLCEGIFLLLFTLSAFIGPIRFFANGVMEGITKSFEAVTGESPYAWMRRKSLAEPASNR